MLLSCTLLKEEAVLRMVDGICMVRCEPLFGASCISNNRRQ